MRRAFSLVELLVVVAIITMLIAILLPALTSARAMARSTQCLANTRSLAQARTARLAENSMQPMPYLNDEILWVGELYLYGLKKKAKTCPEAPEVDPATEFATGRFVGTARSMWRENDANLPAKYQGTIREQVADASYGMNGWTHDFKDPRITITAVPPLSISTLKANAYNRFHDMTQPMNVPWFGDCAWRERFPLVTDIGATSGQGGWGGGGSGQMKMWQMNRHAPKRTNISFADGRAESLHLNDLDQLLWHKNWPKNGSVQIHPQW